MNNEFILEFVWLKKKSSVTAEDNFDMRQCLMSSVFLVSVIIKSIRSFNENCKMDLFPGTSLLLKHISYLCCVSASSSATTSVYNSIEQLSRYQHCLTCFGVNHATARTLHWHLCK